MQSAALLRDQVQSSLGNRFAGAFLAEKPAAETIPSPIGEIPRGALTEIAGPVSSGRTSLLNTLLATMTARQEFCALLDAGGTFDPESAASAGVCLSQLLWVRCGGNTEHALKAADMLSQAGGFGLVAIDLTAVPEHSVHRIPLAAWFRLRHGVENTPAALVVLEQRLHARSCSAMKIELTRARALWRGRLPGGVLDGFDIAARCTQNHRERAASFAIAR